MYMKFEKMYSIHSGKPPNNLGKSEGNVDRECITKWPGDQNI